MKFFIKDFFSKYDQISRKMPIWVHLLKKFLIENFIFLYNDKDYGHTIFCFPKFLAKYMIPLHRRELNPFHVISGTLSIPPEKFSGGLER